MLRPAFALTLSLLLSLPAGTALAQTPAAQTEAGPERLVVLPFRNLSRRAEDDWLGESFSESLTTALGQARQLELVERTQLDMVMREQGLGQSAFADEASAPRLGRLIGARHMLLGSYQKQGTRLQVSARLVDVETGRILSGQSVQLEGEYERLFTLQSQLAGQLLSRLGQQVPSMAALEAELKVTATTSGAEQYQKGVLLARQQTDLHLKQAIALFEGALAQDPDCVLAHVALSEALSQRASWPLMYPSSRPDDLSRALDHAEKALRLQRHPEAVYRALARAHAARDQIEPAMAAISESLRQKPGDTDSILVWLDLQAYCSPDLDQLRTQLRSFQANPEDPWIQFATAMVYLKHHKRHGVHNFEEVRGMLAKVAQALPAHAFVRIKQAWVETLRDRYDLAYERVKEAVGIEPDNYMIQYKAGFLLMPSPAHADAAESYFKKSLDLLPGFGNAELHLGELYLQRGRLDEARPQLLAARTHLPESAEVPMRLGLLAERQGQDSQAYTYLLQALENSGKLMGESLERGRLRLHLARLAGKLQRPAEAEAHARAALSESDVSRGEVYRELIAVPLAKKDFATAQRLFAELQQAGPLNEADQRLYQRIYLLEQLQAKPNDAALLNDLGGIALVEGQLGDAESFLTPAARLAPNQPAILFNLGLLRLQQQRPAEAQQAFRQVLAQDAAHRKAAFNLGRAQLAGGDAHGAKATWESLLRQFPGDADALGALEAL